MTDTAPSNPRRGHALEQVGLLPWKISYRSWPKRAFDVLLALVLLMAATPLILIMCLPGYATGGSAFFGHMRVGRHGTRFRCWKIRTMVPRAEEKLAHLLATDPAAMAEWSRDQKLHNDPRITKFGQFLRKTSLDELPQLWNVLKGEMSLVGPRPITEDELARYGSGQAAYLSMRPGITGLWQVSGRNDVSYAQRVAYDLWYQKRVSLGFDLKVLVWTLRVLWARTGR